MRKPHEILGVKVHPTFSEVRAAYKKLALKYHPDCHPGEEADYQEKMVEIIAAYEYFKKMLPHNEDTETSKVEPSTTSNGAEYEEDTPHKKWDDYTQEERRRIWEEMQERYKQQSREDYKASGRKMREKIARNLEPIRDVNKKFKVDIKSCTNYAELNKVAIAYAERIENMIITMYEYTEKNHRYGMPPESFYHTEVFEENVNKDFPLLKVNSSNILAVGYDINNQYLYVKFHDGSIYIYYGVVKYIYDGLLKADSVGRYFGTYIRNKYKYTRLN